MKDQWREIVVALSERDPVHSSEYFEYAIQDSCSFCLVEPVQAFGSIVHADDCLWQRARDLVKWAE